MSGDLFVPGTRSPALEALEVLALDAQATGATPARGHLLELAWVRTAAAPSPLGAPSVHLVALPPGARLPPRVAALTGLSEADLRGAAPPGAVWAALRAEAGALSARHGLVAAPAVVHFAAWERRFLAALHAAEAPGAPFPLELLCTHAMARRLLPSLPRHGLRALAGRLGHVLSERRRACAHAGATAHVWRMLLPLLGAAGVRSLDDLRDFLSAGAPARAARVWAVSPPRRLAVPEGPGVYRLRAPGGGLLYVGKAVSLRRRVNSWFQRRWRGADRTTELLTQAAEVDFTVTPTALEAALLEADLIKEHAPPYNRALRARAEHAWFATLDLGDVVPAPDDRHPVGPLPGRDALDALCAMRALLAAPPAAAPTPAPERATAAAAMSLPHGLCAPVAPHPAPGQPAPGSGGASRTRASAALARRVLSLPAGTSVSCDVFAAGWQTFVTRARLTAGDPPIAPLLRAGARLWAERLRAAERATVAATSRPVAPGERPPLLLGTAADTGTTSPGAPAEHPPSLHGTAADTGTTSPGAPAEHPPLLPGTAADTGTTGHGAPAERRSSVPETAAARASHPREPAPAGLRRRSRGDVARTGGTRARWAEPPPDDELPLFGGGPPETSSAGRRSVGARRGRARSAPVPPGWTPERVDEQLEEALVRAAHLVRRAHWLVRLAESAVAWIEPGGAQRRYLLISSGRLAGAGALPAGSPPPLPPLHARAAPERRATLDPAACDRLRVLTTELRRLLAHGAPVAVVFGPHRALEGESLARRLAWI